MSRVEMWKQKVRAAHAARADNAAGPQRGLWEEKRSAWFNRFAGKSDRSDTYRFLAPHVHGQVLEIGPGPGAYTRLLAQSAARVVAVEPSPAMVQLLRENLAELGNIEIVQSTIEDYLEKLQRYDLALAANVLSGIEPIDAVLTEVTRHAAVLGIVMGSSAVTPDWSRAVQQQVLDRTVVDADMPGSDDLLAVLDELGLPYETRIVQVPIHTFTSRTDLNDWVEGLFAIPAEQRDILEKALAPFVSKKDGKLGLPSNQETLVVLVRANNVRDR